MYNGSGVLLNGNVPFGLGLEVVPGSYYIQYTLPGGYLFAGIPTPDNNVDASGRTVTFTLASNQSFSSIAAAYSTLPGDILGTMWQDIDGNGIRTGVDAPGSPSPLTVELYTSGGAFVTSTAIGGGPYSFMGIPSGSYYLKFSDPRRGVDLYP